MVVNQPGQKDTSGCVGGVGRGQLLQFGDGRLVVTSTIGQTDAVRTAEGTLVVDASIPYLGIGSIREPFTCRIEQGFITDIEGGGDQVKVLQDDIASHGDQNCWNIAELGVGLNPNARMTGNMLEDEGVLNTIHIGIGTSMMLGGTIKAATHYDLIMWDPTIEIDGKIVQKGLNILV